MFEIPRSCHAIFSGFHLAGASRVGAVGRSRTGCRVVQRSRFPYHGLLSASYRKPLHVNGASVAESNCFSHGASHAARYFPQVAQLGGVPIPPRSLAQNCRLALEARRLQNRRQLLALSFPLDSQCCMSWSSMCHLPVCLSTTRIGPPKENTPPSPKTRRGALSRIPSSQAGWR